VDILTRTSTLDGVLSTRPGGFSVMASKRTVGLVGAVLVLGLAALVLALTTSEEARARGPEGHHDFVVFETVREDPGGRRRRAGLEIYRYGEFEYADARFTKLERFLYDQKKPFGIHNLTAKGFQIVDLEITAGEAYLFVVRIGAQEFERLTGK
jgi:hypothetical protein